MPMGKLLMEVRTEFLSGVAINGTTRTDMGTFFPVVASTLSWAAEYSAPKGAMANVLLLISLVLILTAASTVINKR